MHNLIFYLNLYSINISTMKEISKIIVFATFCLGIVNVSYAEEYKAFACYNKPIIV